MENELINKTTCSQTPSPLERAGERSLITTSDGSHTLFVPEIDECYHSTHGAIQESKHIFIETGLKQCSQAEIRVLEIGFGTGLNAFLTLLEAEKMQKNIHFTSLELYPVELEKAFLLNYPDRIAPEARMFFEKMHTAPWNTTNQISPHFQLEKIETDYTQYPFKQHYDVVFFDAFSPEKQPEMWTEERFELIYKHCQHEAIMTTYCSKGVVRRAMQAAGFVVERLQGPPGKRQILRAVKP